MNHFVIVLGSCLTILCFYAFFYRKVVRQWGSFVQPIIESFGLQTRYSTREVEAVGKLTAAAVAQAIFGLILILVLGVYPRVYPDLVITPIYVLLGAMLGLGELALSSFLCSAIVIISAYINKNREHGNANGWLVQGRGGWMNQFSAIFKITPAWFATLVTCLYVSVEELIFRGFLVELLRESGMVWSVLISTILFVTVQAFSMPTLRGAMFPMIGALVIGAVNGILYWFVPDVLPLIISHWIFFTGALRISPTPALAVRPY